jgi:hypothetical protein
LHFHSLVKQRYVRRWFAGTSTAVRNSITGLLVGFLTLTAIVVAVIVMHSAWQSAMAFLALFFGYVAMYARMVRHHWCSPIQFLMGKSTQQGTSVLG